MSQQEIPDLQQLLLGLFGAVEMSMEEGRDQSETIKGYVAEIRKVLGPPMTKDEAEALVESILGDTP